MDCLRDCEISIKRTWARVFVQEVYAVDFGE